MDVTDDLTYLNYLGDKNDTFLLQNTDQPLGVRDPTLNGQNFLEELADGARIWTVDNLPVLLNNSTSKAQVESVHYNVEGSEIVLSDLERKNPSNNCIENNNDLSYPAEVPEEAFVSTNGLFLTNEVLYQMGSPNIEVESGDNMKIFMDKDNNWYSVKSELPDTNFHDDNVEESIVEGNDSGGDVIQLINTDGTIINIDKNVLLCDNNKKEKSVHLSENIERITAYKCKKCGYLSESLNGVTKHVNNTICKAVKRRGVIIKKDKPKLKSLLNVESKSAEQKLVLLCSECNQGYSTTEELKNHMIAEHQLRSAENNVKETEKEGCKESRKHYLSIVREQQNASRRIKCSTKGCQVRFAKDEYRSWHERCHVDAQKKQFRCPVCDKVFSIWRVCSSHLWKCHQIDTGQLSCVVCDFRTVKPYMLWQHMLTHQDEHLYLCNVCGKRFKQLSALQTHQMSHLIETEGLTELPARATQKRCDICGNILSDRSSLKKHIQAVHNNFKPYVCNICGHKTSRKAMLELHLRQHTGEKPYQCQSCPYHTGDHNSMRRHRMIHDSTTKYSCPYCNYKSIQCSAYKCHVALKHPGKPDGIFRCTHCTYSTINKVAYNSHIKNHENDSVKDENKDQNNSDKAEDKSTSEERILNAKDEQNKSSNLEEDEETQHGFLNVINTDEAVDTGGITIPAGLELHM